MTNATACHAAQPLPGDNLSWCHCRPINWGLISMPETAITTFIIRGDSHRRKASQLGKLYLNPVAKRMLA